MNSPFNPSTASLDVDLKIIVALERISEVFRVLLWGESKDTGLSPIQIQILIFVLFHRAEQCNVSNLAHEFNLSKATISESIKVLLQKELLNKVENLADSRSFSVGLSEQGSEVAKKASLFTEVLNAPIENLTEAQKDVMLESLFSLIRSLNKSGIIKVQRMCFNCGNYENLSSGHYCNLLRSHLLVKDLRLDCPEFKQA